MTCQHPYAEQDSPRRKARDTRERRGAIDANEVSSSGQPRISEQQAKAVKTLAFMKPYGAMSYVQGTPFDRWHLGRSEYTGWGGQNEGHQDSPKEHYTSSSIPYADRILRISQATFSSTDFSHSG